jgi:hypothetical protein
MLWFIPPIVSALAWIGIDLGLDFLMGDESVQIVGGMDAGMFFELYWMEVICIIVIVAVGIWFANPKRNKKGRR